MVGYYVVLALIVFAMKDRPVGYELKTWVFYHNAFLSIGSLALLLGIIYELLKLNQSYSMFEIFCPARDVTGREGGLFFYYYVNYIFKYIELIDTIQLALKKRELTLLHTYHHGATLLLTAVMLKARVSVQFIHIGLNLTVHVLMYGYYAASVVIKKYNPWWKSHLTTMQIIQFVLGLAAGLYAIHLRVTQNICHGDIGSANLALLILLSYLLLFIRFFISTYILKKRPGKEGGSKEGAASKDD